MLGDDAADERAGEPEADRREDPHRIGAGEREPRERADHEAEEGEKDDEADAHVSSLSP